MKRFVNDFCASLNLREYHNLLCQVNVLFKFHNQLKDYQCTPSNVLEQRGKSVTRHYEIHKR